MVQTQVCGDLQQSIIRNKNLSRNYCETVFILKCLTFVTREQQDTQFHTLTVIGECDLGCLFSDKLTAT